MSAFVLSSGNDYTFVKLPITIAVMYFSSYLCISTINVFYSEVNFNVVTKYFIYAILLQSLIVVIQFVNPEIASLISQIQRLTERQVNISTSQLEDGSRFIGFGLLFYTASFFYGTALILIAFQLKYKSMTQVSKISGLLIYLVIFFIGMGLARSTIIGFASSLIVFIFPIKSVKSIINITFKFIISIILTILTIFIIIKIFPTFTKSLEALINNAFDFVIAYINTGKLSSESASGTIDYFVFPNDIRTYLVGTGLYETYFSKGDYNYSDVGYLRLLYYFGIPGMILFLIVEVKLLKLAFKTKKLKPIYYSMLIILFITNIKGLTTLAVIAMLYALIPNKKMDSYK
ncbi:hypothetical protein FOR85_06745 [Psychrobacter sp. YGAH215]|uniref:hypothetical protein n=1 Tax=Psychrobacter sp. YGAH215 TaxID=2596826 RepID=UPI0011872BFE|nr:hypothetical protein [Psychrobacter sp. YGAH215]TSB23295.1 hypothetical protein FOR85_06745 [Psychrobacter sp. YGAH215]